MSQTRFANHIGMSYRNYQERMAGDQPDWKISQLIRISEIENKIDVDYEGKTYRVEINKLD